MSNDSTSGQVPAESTPPIPGAAAPEAPTYAAPQAPVYGAPSPYAAASAPAYPGYPAAGQAYPVAGQAYAPAAPTNVLAIVSLILSILGISIVAVILGHMAMSKIAKTGEQGKGLAIAGLILGYIGCLAWILLIGVYIWVLAVFGLSSW